MNNTHSSQLNSTTKTDKRNNKNMITSTVIGYTYCITYAMIAAFSTT